MLRHSEIWRALDRLAAKHGLSASGLARRAGLDPTAFNKSKRKSPTGKPRWPSTESVAKCLAATGESLGGFLALMGERSGIALARRLPMLNQTKAGSAGVFDDSGHPTGRNWDEVDAPSVSDPNTYALKISGNALAPVYRAGDIVVVSPDAEVRRGDRVIVKTRQGELLARELVRQSAQRLEVRAIVGSPTVRSLPKSDVLWVARVQWVRQ
jgi:phage repressor protein C with HTH and peptisase S24 domain